VTSKLNLLDVVIETRRLVLRPVEHTYATTIFAVFTADVCRHMFPQPARHIGETLAYIDQSRMKMAAGVELAVSIFLPHGGELIGGVGMHELKSATPEVGIWIKTAAHRHGYGLEAVEGLIRWTAHTYGVRHVRYPVMTVNGPSRRIPERLGGRLVRRFQKANANGIQRDLVEYLVPCPSDAADAPA